MADMITANFSVKEMACRFGCGTLEIDPEFMWMLQELRDQMQGPLRVSAATDVTTTMTGYPPRKIRKMGSTPSAKPLTF